MYFVYSTLTCPNIFVTYLNNSSKDVSVPIKKVLIHGGHGVANKQFVTPKGVVTSVTEEEMEEHLLKNVSFMEHVANGFITYEKKKVDPEKRAADMKDKDGSAPITPADYEKSENSDEGTPVYKKKGKK